MRTDLRQGAYSDRNIYSGSAGSEVNLSPLALLVLELLAERDMHPYEMRQLLLNRGRDKRIKITPGSLSRTVERLTDDGLAEVMETSRAGKRPERTVTR